jgi:hypothetical protein
MHLIKLKRVLGVAVLSALAALVLPAAASAASITATTLAATNVTAKAATLNAQVYTGNGTPGDQIVYGFEYGTTTAYGSETEGELSEVGGGYIYPSQTIEGLKPSTTYHFRVLVVGEGKFTYGQDRQFTTAAPGPVGVYLTGKASESPAEQPRIAAEKFPVALSGSQSAENPVVLTVNNRTVKCGGTSFQSELTASTSSLPLSAQYESCTGFGLPTTVNMNSCRYQLNVSNAGPPYGGTWGVSCGKEGDAIEINVNGGTCTLTIAGQSGAGEVALANTGEGQERRVALTLQVKGLKVTVKGSIQSCGTNGLRENTNLTGWVSLKGVEA